MADKELREDLEALAKFWEDAMDGDSVFAYELRSVLAAHPPDPDPWRLTKEIESAHSTPLDPAVEYGTPPYTAKSTPPEPAEGTGLRELLRDLHSKLYHFVPMSDDGRPCFCIPPERDRTPASHTKGCREYRASLDKANAALKETK